MKKYVLLPPSPVSLSLDLCVLGARISTIPSIRRSSEGRLSRVRGKKSLGSVLPTESPGWPRGDGRSRGPAQRPLRTSHYGTGCLERRRENKSAKWLDPRRRLVPQTLRPDSISSPTPSSWIQRVPKPLSVLPSPREKEGSWPPRVPTRVRIVFYGESRGFPGRASHGGRRTGGAPANT